MRKKVTIRGVDTEAWDALKQMRDEEQRLVGAIISDAIFEYHDNRHDMVEFDGAEELS